MSRRATILSLLAAALLALGVVQLDGVGRPGADGVRTGRVVRVVDGDTIKVRVGGSVETVRYIGVDTPESVKPGTPVQCFAKAASAANRRLVDGRTVRLVADREPRDRYGRALAYVYVVGAPTPGAFVNARLVAAGYARTLEIAPNDRFASRFTALQNAARAGRRGLWRAC